MKKKPPISVLWYSNPSWVNSGYGKQTRYICAGLHKYGYRVGMQPNYGMGAGTIHEFDGYRIHPQGHDLSMPEAVQACMKYNYDAMITLYDHFVLGPLAKIVREQRAPWVAYPPMDFTIVNRQLADILNAATYIVPMCKYGEGLLKRAGFDNVWKPIYHGVDTDIYKPLTDQWTKDHMRNVWMGWKNKSFVISCFKMNKGDRVKIAEQLEGIKIFLNNNPDLQREVGVYLHCLPNVDGGIDLTAVQEMLGLENMIRFAEPYKYIEGYSEYEMSQLYNASDCVLNCTSSGGFEVCIIESMACGTPVVTTDVEVMHELIEPVTPELGVRPISEYWTPAVRKEYQPDVSDIAAKIELVMKGDPKRYAEILPKYARETFEFDLVVPQWSEFLEFFRAYKDELCVYPPATTSEYLKRRARTIVEVAAK